MRRDDWDPRAVISVIVLVGAFALALVALITNHPGATVPAWVVVLLGAIGATYYKTNGKDS